MGVQRENMSITDWDATDLAEALAAPRFTVFGFSRQTCQKLMIWDKQSADSQ